MNLYIFLILNLVLILGMMLIAYKINIMYCYLDVYHDVITFKMGFCFSFEDAQVAKNEMEDILFLHTSICFVYCLRNFENVNLENMKMKT